MIMHSFRCKYFLIFPNQRSVWNVKFDTARLTLSCKCFLPGVATGGGRLTFWGRRGKFVVWGDNGKNKVLKRGAESVRKKVLLLVYHHTAWFYFSLHFLQTNVLVDCEVYKNKNSRTGDEPCCNTTRAFLWGISNNNLTETWFPYVCLYDTTFNWIMCH